MLFVSGVGYIFYLQPLLLNKKVTYLRIKDLNIQLEEKQKILSKYAVNTDQLASLKRQFFLGLGNTKKYNKNEALLAVISGQRLPEASTINYMRSGISQDETAFVEFPVEVAITSNEKNIELFLYQIANVQYPILLNKFTWNFFDFVRAEGKGKLTTSFILYLEDVASKRFFSIPAHEGVSYTNYLDKEILTHYALSEIKRVGFLSDFSKKIWALVQFPDKQFHKVELNDELGLERARVIHIDAKKIVIQEKNNTKSIELSMESKDS